MIREVNGQHAAGFWSQLLNKPSQWFSGGSCTCILGMIPVLGAVLIPRLKGRLKCPMAAVPNPSHKFSPFICAHKTIACPNAHVHTFPTSYVWLGWEYVWHLDAPKGSQRWTYWKPKSGFPVQVAVWKPTRDCRCIESGSCTSLGENRVWTWDIPVDIPQISCKTSWTLVSLHEK